MSKLIVEVCRVDAIENHPNAERLKIATVKGWKTCIRHDPDTGSSQFAVGDKCVFFPPDAVLPAALANDPADAIPGRLGIVKYLKMLPKNADGSRPDGGRVAAARLRGVPSFGVIMHIDPAVDPDWEIGADVADHFGVTKWEPPPERVDGDAEPAHPRFFAYTNIENFGNYPTAIEDGVEVVLTEKIHGMNCRIGTVLVDGEAGSEWTPMAGSHGVRRKQRDAKGRQSEFWEARTANVESLLAFLRDEYPWPEEKQSVMLFGEIYGSAVQDMTYGLSNGRRGFRAFDISINDRYLDFDVKRDLLGRFNVEMVPILHRGPFSRAMVEEFTDGATTMCLATDAGGFTGREGIVITPTKEEYSNVLFGRLILKSISADYLARKNATDGH